MPNKNQSDFVWYEDPNNKGAFKCDHEYSPLIMKQPDFYEWYAEDGYIYLDGREDTFDAARVACEQSIRNIQAQRYHFTKNCLPLCPISWSSIPIDGSDDRLIMASLPFYHEFKIKKVNNRTWEWRFLFSHKSVEYTRNMGETHAMEAAVEECQRQWDMFIFRELFCIWP